MLNAAIWLGAALFYTMSVAPALISGKILELLRGQNSQFFSGAISQIVLARYCYWHTLCAFVALLHLLVEWLYLGRALHRFWSGLLAVLLGLGLLGSFWLCPKLAGLHRAQYYLNVRPESREAAAKSFRLWQEVFHGINVLVIGGVTLYFWRATHPPDALRFLTAGKFRS